MPLDEANKQEMLIALNDFCKGFFRYKELILLKRSGRQTGSQEIEFQALSFDLQRKYGSLKEVIEEYGGSATLLLQGGRVKYEAFSSAFSYTRFSQEALIAVLDTAITTINAAIGKLEKELHSKRLPSEVVYPSGKPYDAYKHIKGITSEATKELTIVDPYVDSTLFVLLENVKPGVNIKILTLNMRGDFELSGSKFKGQREKALHGTLEVRTSDKFHDRFMVADGKFFHIGASIKDIGTKLCAISEFEGQDIKAVLSETISRYWDEAKVVL
jgi:hypothetical protein